MSTQREYVSGILGKKLGMSQIFTEDGSAIPVTVIETGPCYVTQVKTVETDGYAAAQISYEPKKQQRVNKALTGHYAKAGRGGFYHTQEVRCDIAKLGWDELGKEIVVGDVFEEGDFLDITGVSKGRGFQGVVRRFGVRGQPATRGTHEKRRNIGSIGMCQDPGKVWKNQKMPGHMGNKNVTTTNMRVVKIVADKNLLLVRGCVPGAKNGVLTLKLAKKKKRKA